MEDLAVFTALNHLSSFRNNFIKLKNIYVIYWPRVGPYGEKPWPQSWNTALGLWPRAVFSRPLSQFFTIRTSQLANNICLFPEIEYQISFYLEDKLVYYHWLWWFYLIRFTFEICLCIGITSSSYLSPTCRIWSLDFLAGI